MSHNLRILPPRIEDEPQAVAPPEPPPAIAGLDQVFLIGFPPVVAGRVMEPILEAVPGVSFQIAQEASLESPSFPEGALLVLPQRLAGAGDMAELRRLRTAGLTAPVLVIVTEGPCEPPRDLADVEPIDVANIDDFSVFSFRRSLTVFGAGVARERMLAEVAGGLQAYEQVLETQDDEHLRVLAVAASLERQLAEKEDALRQRESTWAEQVARAEAHSKQLESRIAELETLGRAQGAAGESDLVRQLHQELKTAREEQIHQAATIAELHQTCAAREHELAEPTSSSVPEGDLAAKLEASERVRGAQTREIARSQQRIDELEQNLETIGTVLQADHGDPEVLLEKLGTRLTKFERMRHEQQRTINQLSHSLAMQQVDDSLDDAQSRRNIVRRVGNSVRRSQRFGVPLFCAIFGIDGSRELRAQGSVLFDFLLVQIAERLKRTLRQNDVLMRYGDEGFLLLPDTKNIEQARACAARLVKYVCDEPLELSGKRVKPSLSVAIVAYDQEIGGANELLRLAKNNLLQAQTEGERQIRVGGRETPEPLVAALT